MTVKARFRLAGTLTVAAVLVTSCAAGGHQHPAADGAAVTARFSAMGVAFRYPAAWRSGTWSDDVSSFSAPIIDLSVGALHDPCQRSVNPGVTSVWCGDPAGQLEPGGVLVRWSEHGFPDWRSPKANTRIGGRPAAEIVTTAAWCTVLDGTRTVSAVIPSAVRWNWYEMDSCLRGPGIASEQAEITAMLASVRFTADS